MTGMWAVAMLTGTTHRVHNSVGYVYGLSRSISYSTTDNYHVASVTQTENPSLWNKVALSVQQRLYKFTVRVRCFIHLLILPMHTCIRVFKSDASVKSTGEENNAPLLLIRLQTG